jgi:hypothetical protein
MTLVSFTLKRSNKGRAMLTPFEQLIKKVISEYEKDNPGQKPVNKKKPFKYNFELFK